MAGSTVLTCKVVGVVGVPGFFKTKQISSKYGQMWYSFEVFVIRNTMMQWKINFDILFVSCTFFFPSLYLPVLRHGQYLYTAYTRNRAHGGRLLPRGWDMQKCASASREGRRIFVGDLVELFRSHKRKSFKLKKTLKINQNMVKRGLVSKTST